MHRRFIASAAALVVAAFFCAACPARIPPPAPLPPHLPTEAERTEPVDPKALDLTPSAIFQPVAAYPAAAKRARLYGYVEIEIVVDRDGNVASAKVVKSDALFDAVTLETVRTWRYEPLRYQDRVVSWRGVVTMHFQP